MEGTYRRILVPIDGSPTAARGLTEAIGLARLSGARLRLLHVLDQLVFPIGFEPGTSYANDVLPRLRREGERILADGRARAEAAGVPAEAQLRECFGVRAADVVCRDAVESGADLIVLGTHGRRGIARALLGSDAELVLRSAPVPVLLVREGAVTEAR